MQNSDAPVPVQERSFCLNCAAPLSEGDRFCPVCGQKRIGMKDHSVWHLLVDSVGDFFHFDSKFFRTLKDLLFRPGFLTIEYLAGRRVRYFQPFKMFLFISVLYFLTAGWMEHKEERSLPSEPAKDTIVTLENLDDIRYTFGDGSQRLFRMPLDSLKMQVRHHGLNRLVDIHYPRESWISRMMVKQAVKSRIKGSETMTETFGHTLSRLIFLLIPFFALLLKLLYVRRRVPYFNHIIFSLHFIAFVFMILWMILFLSRLWEFFEAMIILLPVLYLFLALKKVYRQSFGKTLLKWALFLFSSVIVLAVFLVLVMTVSFMLI